MPKFLPIMGIAAAFSLLCGCTLQPSYTRPSAPIPASWPAANGSADSQAGLPDWREVFPDPKLDQLIQLGLANNRDLRMAALNVETVQARYRIQRSQLFPSIDISAGGEAQHLPGGLWSTQSTGPVTYHQDDVQLGITSYELDLFGRLRSLRAEALENYFSQVETRRATQISLIAQIATSYLELCADTDSLALAQNTARNQHDEFQLVQLKYRQEVATAQDLAQAETALRSAEADVSAYTRQVEQDRNALTLLVGSTIPDNLLQTAHLDQQVQPTSIPAGLPSKVLLDRPDVLAAEHQLKAANADIGAARAAFFPSISLTASGGSTSSSLSKLFDAGTGSWTFMPSINLPIFTGGRNRANLDVAKLSRETEVANYEKTIQTAFREVADALAGVNTYDSELVARRKDLIANNTNYQLATMRYQQGVDDYLAVLVAQRLQYQASQAVISTQLGLLNQRTALYKALGGGWNSGDGPAPRLR